MFTGFMVDASNIMTFESVGNMSSDVKYSVEFWIFKPKSNGEQVYIKRFGESSSDNGNSIAATY